jgi:hypothetical protein
VSVFTIRMNDAAAAALGVLSGLDAAVPPDRLSPGLRRLGAEGVEVRGDDYRLRTG